MTRSSVKPPPVIGIARVLSYAEVDASVKFSGHTRLFVNAKEVGRVPCLAICEEGKKVGLFHCDRKWAVLGHGGSYKSIAEAKDRAETIYPGLSKRWTKAHVTKAQAIRYLNDVWKDLLCSFCGKRPDEVKQLISYKKRVRICDVCIRKFHAMLKENS